MKFQLKALILWPRFEAAPPRVVTFRVGAVNVITGHSKTGKSAIIPIIDYCLGSGRCAIPVGRIRQACSWFGVVIETESGEILLARKEPEHLKSTGEMFVMQGKSLTVPETVPTKNSTVDETKFLLNRTAALTDLGFDMEADRSKGPGFKARPSFRDMMAFTFQPQNIVANPNVLFFKADSAEHREKLKTIFPFVLGAVTRETLLLQHELSLVRAELKRKERELDSLRAVSTQWTRELRGRLGRAVELGLLPMNPSDGATLEEMLSMLRSAATNADQLPLLNAGSLEFTSSKLASLDAEERTASSELSELRRQQAHIARYQEAARRYASSIAVRRERLGISEWVGALYSAHHECPLCGHADAPGRESIDALRVALRRIEKVASATPSPAETVDRDVVRVRRAIESLTDRLNGIRREREELSRGSVESAREQYRQAEAARFAGMATESIRQYEAIAFDASLTIDVNRLRAEVDSLEAKVRERSTRQALSRAGHDVSNRIARLLPTLEAERSHDPVQLAVEELTVKVGGDGRDDFLWEIGSGANWVSYHVAVTLALQQFFVSQKSTPVPSFIVYDQPSQVYFPKQAASAEDEVEPVAQSIPDEDIQAVRRIFRTIASAVRESGGGLQALVLDHAAADVWGGIDGVHLVEEWRFGTKLVPDSWATTAKVAEAASGSERTDEEQ